MAPCTDHQLGLQETQDRLEELVRLRTNHGFSWAEQEEYTALVEIEREHLAARLA